MVSTPPGSFFEHVHVARRALEAAGWTAGDARLDAEVLARNILEWEPTEWLLRGHETALAPFVAAYDDALARRLRHEPVAYILGRREFYGRPFLVTPAVLIPRPETELVVDEALSALPAVEQRPGFLLNVADVGTGSGCLAVTLALERPDLAVTATDISMPALAVAARNRAAFRVRDRVHFVQTSLLDAAAPASLDLVVANPPYVRNSDRDHLMPDVRDYEPAAALFGGPDGLDVVRALLPAAARALRPGGALVIEIGAGQAAAALGLVEASPLTIVQVTNDLAGIPRVLVARRPEP